MSECDTCGEHCLDCNCKIKISDSDLEKYVNQAFTEEVIQGYENQILSIMKHRQEKYPSEKNDREWLAFTNFVCRRRYADVNKMVDDKLRGIDE